MLQVDNVREVRLRRYRVSLKDSEQGQRCRNSVAEPRQQLMIKAAAPATHQERDGQKHEARRGDTGTERTKNKTFITLPGKPLIVSCLFFPGTHKKTVLVEVKFLRLFLRDFMVILWESLALKIT